MRRKYSLILTVNGHKKAADLIVNEGGTLDYSTPEVLKVAEQVLQGAPQGNSTTRFGKVSFTTLKSEFIE